MTKTLMSRCLRAPIPGGACCLAEGDGAKAATSEALAFSAGGGARFVPRFFCSGSRAKTSIVVGNPPRLTQCRHAPSACSGMTALCAACSATVGVAAISFIASCDVGADESAAAQCSVAWSSLARQQSWSSAIAEECGCSASCMQKAAAITLPQPPVKSVTSSNVIINEFLRRIRSRVFDGSTMRRVYHVRH